MSTYPFGGFQYLFLCAVCELGDGAYGLKICELLESQLGRKVNVGQIYMAGKRLSSRGLLKTETIRRPGARLVVRYSFTKKGLEEMQARVNKIQHLLAIASARSLASDP